MSRPREPRSPLLHPLLRRMVLALCAVVPALLVAPTTSVAAPARIFLIGDSVAAWSADTLQRELGSTLVLDAVPCRGTLYSCAASGQKRPASGLHTIQANRGRLGDLVVVELGYNDRPGAKAIDRIMRELRSQGVRRVAWVNLSERRSGYRDTNRALAAALQRWPELRVLDWRAVSAGRASWFIDGVHLTAPGRTAFARFLAHALGVR